MLLAVVLTVIALVAPNRRARTSAVYRLTDRTAVVAVVPRRAPDELAARALVRRGGSDQLDVAVALARRDIERGRALADPRYLGRAEATLAHWWSAPQPPPDVLLLRATIEQSLHDFPAARRDLDQLVRLRPDDAQAQLTRAVVATVTGDYAAARQSCDALERIGPSLIAATCRAPLEALGGRARPAYERLLRELRRSEDADGAVTGWTTTVLAELAIQDGDWALAESQLRTVLARNAADVYALGLLGDVLLAGGEPAVASQELAHHEEIDELLVRRAIAEARAGGPDAASLAARMRERLSDARVRSDRIHLREEARFALEVDHDAARAVSVARENWAVQHELADARLLAESAAAAGDSAAAVTIAEWAASLGVRDVQLDRALKREAHR